MEGNNDAPATAMSVRMKVEIVSYGCGLYRGKLHSRYLEAPFEFSTFVRMMEKMEAVFDLKKFPQASLSPRYFMDKKKGKSVKPETNTRAVVNDTIDLSLYEGPGNGSCTFEILVRFRQNATWQGQILWVEKDLKRDFLSELEMLKLMDEALIEFESDTEQLAWEGN